MPDGKVRPRHASAEVGHNMAELPSFELPLSESCRLPPIPPCDIPRPKAQPTFPDKGKIKGKKKAVVTGPRLARTAAAKNTMSHNIADDDGGQAAGP
ncbi:hypothetical protein SNOG_05069 [Parastagonospora nodorum SN15]|uniref:Uncharacterized protein n=1 Tax=Phaeosphaeria nodorum (strain SN15 / ATCC MYA-4574 / FGSC 10173) TaxID=321614 RepID=Q0UT45_PHANO|nr:hypothetical protein SNOG_05069 [Parastagonospora nodorum SN15]EAT87460.1 hypothetical protein SNOG_05069 [Parastagonospora nodorum SN15]